MRWHSVSTRIFLATAMTRGLAAYRGRSLIIADLSTHEAFVKSPVGCPRGASRPPLVIVAGGGRKSRRCGSENPSRSGISSFPSPCIAMRWLWRSARRPAGGPPRRRTGTPIQPWTLDIIGGHVLLVEDEPVNAAVAQGYLSDSAAPMRGWRMGRRRSHAARPNDSI